jgi:hypothetical protein
MSAWVTWLGLIHPGWLRFCGKGRLIAWLIAEGAEFCNCPPDSLIEYNTPRIAPSSLMPWPLTVMTQTPPMIPITPSISKNAIDDCFLDSLCIE